MTQQLMKDTILTAVLHCGLTGILLLIIQRRIKLTAWLLLYVLIFCHHVILYLPPIGFFSGQTLNWQGKCLTLLWAIPFVYLYPGIKRSEFGWVTKSTRGSWIPILAGTFLLAILLYLPGFSGRKHEIPSLEKILYYASLPGLAEEIVYRGILLAFLKRGLGSGINLLGAHIGWGAIVGAALYGFLHGLSIYGGYHLGHNWTALFLTFGTGFFFTWVRERAGSLWPAVVSHNLLNLASLV